jgi:hypothetical protein
MNSNYLDAFNAILSGTNQTAQTGADAGKAFADTNLNIISGMNDTLGNMIGLGDSYGKTGSMRVGDLLGVAQGYGDYSGIANQNAGTLMGAGSQRIQDWLNISKGYNDSAAGYGSALDLNLKERAGLQDDLSKYYANAASPMLPAYDLMKTMQLDHWNSDKKDTVVQQKTGCYITTAACEHLGKPDGCYELTALRHFRDMWLRLQPGGEELVRGYYEAAPRIVGRLGKSPDRDGIYKAIWEEGIVPCVRLIEAGEYGLCRDRYAAMASMLDGMFPEEEEEEEESEAV